MKSKKVIYISIISIILMNLICLRTENYTNYYDKSELTFYSKKITDNIRITVQYLHDSKEEYDRYVIKNLRGRLLTEIDITRCVPDNKENFHIRILYCHVQIFDDLNNVIPYSNIEILNHEYSVLNNTISYLNEDQYLKSNPEMTEDDLATYRIYYTYPYSNFHNVEDAIINI